MSETRAPYRPNPVPPHSDRLGLLGPGIRERFVAASRYDRACKVHLAIQQVYDRWAGEVFRTQRAR